MLILRVLRSLCMRTKIKCFFKDDLSICLHFSIIALKMYIYDVYVHVCVERGHVGGCWWKEGRQMCWGGNCAFSRRGVRCGGGENFVWMSALDTQTKLGMSLDDLAARAGGGGRLIQSGIVGKRSFRRSMPYKMYQPRESSGYGQRLGQSRWFIPPTSSPYRWTNKECLLEDHGKK